MNSCSECWLQCRRPSGAPRDCKTGQLPAKLQLTQHGCLTCRRQPHGRGRRRRPHEQLPRPWGRDGKKGRRRRRSLQGRRRRSCCHVTWRGSWRRCNAQGQQGHHQLPCRRLGCPAILRSYDDLIALQCGVMPVSACMNCSSLEAALRTRLGWPLSSPATICNDASSSGDRHGQMGYTTQHSRQTLFMHVWLL